MGFFFVTTIIVVVIHLTHFWAVSFERWFEETQTFYILVWMAILTFNFDCTSKISRKHSGFNTLTLTLCYRIAWNLPLWWEHKKMLNSRSCLFHCYSLISEILILFSTWNAISSFIYSVSFFLNFKFLIFAWIIGSLRTVLSWTGKMCLSDNLKMYHHKIPLLNITISCSYWNQSR